MQLEQFLRDVEVLGRSGPLPAAVAGLHYDSRRIQPGWAFVAVRGEQSDGHDFIPQALARGASLVLSERAPGDPNLAWVRIAHPRAALAQAAANWFDRPAEQLRLVGITGTNGKTTTSYLIEALLRAAGMHTGLLGTIEYHIGNLALPSPHTTPESYDLQALLARMVAARCGAAVLEVSSHALAMDRVWGCSFEVAVFTNLTQDHLDYHGTMENYRAAKRRLFEGVGAPPPRAAVVNADDAAAAEITRGFGGERITFGFGAGAGLRASDLINQPSGLSFVLQAADGYRRQVSSPLLGRVNALNLMAAIGVGWALGLEREVVVTAACGLPRVRGRFERVYEGQPFTVVVDYAHTPDALANLLALARELTGGRVLLVFGCGGDRDRAKRPLMGQAAQAADWVIVTSDNPRTEEPLAIIDDILPGLAGSPAAVEPARAAAIEAALREARTGDIVVIAGKGHEDYQIIGEQRLPFDDVQVAREALRQMGWSA